MASEFNSWNLSKARGKIVEEFVRDFVMPALGIECWQNNEGEDDVKNVDLRGRVSLFEVKTAFTPYPKDPTPAGLSPTEHLTLDYSNIEKYADDVMLIIVYRYFNIPKVYAIMSARVKTIISENPKRVYTRSGRSFKDKQKKLAISTAECVDLSSQINEEALQKILEIP